MAKMDPIGDYIKSESKEVQGELKKLYAIVRKAAPKAAEKLAWGMPTLHQEGNIVHFAAFKKHMSLFPGADAMKRFEKELGELATSKGTIQFQYGTKLPVALITRIVKFNLKENLADAKKKRVTRK